VFLARVSDRGRLTITSAIADFGGAASITNVAFDEAGDTIFFANSDGALRALSVDGATDAVVGDVGAGAWSLAIHTPSAQLAVVNSVQTDEAGNVLDAGGVTLTSVGGVAAKRAGPGVGSQSAGAPVGTCQISRPYGHSQAPGGTKRGE
jgi:hypothetical protein